MYFTKISRKFLLSSSLYQTISVKKNSTLSSFTAHNLSNVRSLVKVTGDDSAKYLQNLITNDINLLNDPKKKSIYAMVLNNRGRVLHDVLVYGLGNEEKNKGYLVEMDKMFLGDFLRMLKVYKIRKKVEVESVDEDFRLFALTNDSVNNKPEELVLKETNTPTICVADPRYSPLGFRFITQNKDAPMSDFFQSTITHNTNHPSLYKQHLYKHGIAENHDNIKYATSIPLEYNIVLLDGVSFSKGCYLGQELIAKTHHTGVVRKRIMPITLSDEAMGVEFKEDSIVLNVKSGKKCGKLRGASGRFGIAMLRLSELDEDGLVILDEDGRQYPIKYNVPEYWSRDSKLIESLKKK